MNFVVCLQVQALVICVVVSDLPESGQKLVVGRSGLNLRIYLTIVLCEVLIVK